MAEFENMRRITSREHGRIAGEARTPPCGKPVKWTASASWLIFNQPALREALHVPATSNFFDGDNGAGMVYRSTEPDLRPFYQRVIVYYGDTDPFVAQDWTSHLGFAPTQSWRAWTIDGCRRMGGYVTRYDVRGIALRLPHDPRQRPHGGARVQARGGLRTAARVAQGRGLPAVRGVVHEAALKCARGLD
eukprot:scaffold121999_cov67-Phaeocystis_antarctica.AAC.3